MVPWNFDATIRKLRRKLSESLCREKTLGVSAGVDGMWRPDLAVTPHYLETEKVCW